jgi:predicted GIY-YIG superfamily endonuclease
VQPTQQRFWPDPQPLVERLGRDFFKRLPERPGVYLMRDAGEVVLYIGKAKNLRKRLGSYRVANPERMPRRHLRLLRAVVRIDLQECEDERAALAREAELLRTLKPRFNRAGTWPGKPRFLAWRTNNDSIEFGVTGSPPEDWDYCGPMGTGAFPLCALLARLLWLALNPARSVERLPEGWAAGQIVPPVRVRGIGEDSSVLLEARARLAALLTGQVDEFCQWIENRRPPIGTLFERVWLEAEFESVREWFKPSRKGVSRAATHLNCDDSLLKTENNGRAESGFCFLLDETHPGDNRRGP